MVRPGSPIRLLHAPEPEFRFFSFFLVDASIGYRLPKRFGIFSLEVRNLFDTEFFYRDHNIQVAEQTVTPRFFPTRTVLGRLTLSF